MTAPTVTKPRPDELLAELARLERTWRDLSAADLALVADRGPATVPRRAWAWLLMTCDPGFLRAMADFREAVRAVAKEYDDQRLWDHPRAVPADLEGPHAAVLHRWHALSAWFAGTDQLGGA